MSHLVSKVLFEFRLINEISQAKVGSLVDIASKFWGTQFEPQCQIKGKTYIYYSEEKEALLTLRNYNDEPNLLTFALEYPK